MLNTLALRALAAVIPAVLAAAPVLAQDDAAASEPEIIVEAPRPLPTPPETTERSPYSGRTVIVATLRMSVHYGDLDLADAKDAERLMTRIERVARDACTQLDRLYPLSSDTECLARTVKGAQPSAQAAIEKAIAAKTQP